LAAWDQIKGRLRGIERRNAEAQRPSRPANRRPSRPAQSSGGWGKARVVGN